MNHFQFQIQFLKCVEAVYTLVLVTASILSKAERTFFWRSDDKHSYDSTSPERKTQIEDNLLIIALSDCINLLHNSQDNFTDIARNLQLEMTHTWNKELHDETADAVWKHLLSECLRTLFTQVLEHHLNTSSSFILME